MKPTIDSIKYADTAIKALEQIEQRYVEYITVSSKGKVMTNDNKWVTVPLVVASPGVLSSTMKNNWDTSIITTLIYIPANGHIMPHKHDKQVEVIHIISGLLKYELYDTDLFSKVIETGMLKEGDSFVIAANRTHFVFSASVDVYVKVTLKNTDTIN